MKQVMTKLAMAAAGLAVLAGVTYGAFQSNAATITGVTLGSSTPALQVFTGTVYADTADLGISETGMYPGWTGSDHLFWLKNTSTDTTPFGKILATLPSATSNWAELKDVVLMQFQEVGGSATAWQTLDWWNLNSANVMSVAPPFTAGSERQFTVRFKMDAAATDAAKGKTLTMTLSFVGETP